MRHMAVSKASHASKLGGVLQEMLACAVNLRSETLPEILQFQQVRAPDGSGARNFAYTAEPYYIHRLPAQNPCTPPVALLGEDFVLQRNLVAADPTTGTALGA